LVISLSGRVPLACGWEVRWYLAPSQPHCQGQESSALSISRALTTTAKNAIFDEKEIKMNTPATLNDRYQLYVEAMISMGLPYECFDTWLNR